MESLNEDTGRVMVKFAIGGNRDYVNEYLLQLVSRAEFDQYGKVLSEFAESVKWSVEQILIAFHF